MNCLFASFSFIFFIIFPPIYPNATPTIPPVIIAPGPATKPRANAMLIPTVWDIAAKKISVIIDSPFFKTIFLFSSPVNISEKNTS